jgi:hypothetical protein
MATDLPAADAATSGEELFYANIEPLDPQRHGRLGMMRSDDPFAFASKQAFVPLQASEFGQAAIHYPIIFAGDERAPLAVMGVRAGENLFARADGGFRHAAHVPAFLRRYPFASALNEQANRLFIFIDRGCELFTEDDPEVPLFENGEPTAFLQTCIDVCRRYDADARATVAFVRRLGELDLFEARRTVYTPQQPGGASGEPQTIAEYFAVSEARLKALSPEVLAQLRDDGTLALIYAHLVSLQVWDRLIEETIALAARAAPPAASA